MIPGDQYLVPIEIKMGNTAVTPENCAGVKIAIGGTVKEYPGDVTFSNDAWLYPMTQGESLALSQGLVGVQVQVNLGGDFPEIITSDVTCEAVGDCMIREVWGE